MTKDINPIAVISEDVKKRLKDPSILYNLRDGQKPVPVLSSGVASIDEALNGGIPEGRIIEVFGGEAQGKTTVTLHFAANAQKLGYVVYFIDAEQALDLEYARRCGVNVEDLQLSHPDYGEQALELARCICDSVIEFNESDKANTEFKALIIIDSVPALVPKQEFEVYNKDGLDNTVAMGAQARMMAKLIPTLVSRAAKSKIPIVFINQVRDKIGVSWGSPETTPGGRALKFFASTRIKVTRIGLYKESGEPCGIKCTLVPIKSKTFSVFGKKAEFTITANGIDITAGLAENLIEQGLVEKSGAWITYGENRWHGAKNFYDAIRENPDLADEIMRSAKNEGQEKQE